MFEGVPNYPDFSRFWQVVDKYQVEIFYAAPTALRALMREGDEWVKKNQPQEPETAWDRWASRSTPRRGNGIIRWSATAAARSWTPGGRPRPAAT